MVSKIKSDEIEASSGTTGASVDFNSALRPMSKTNTQMNALSGMGAGDMIYNSTHGTLYVYNGDSWNAMSDNTFTMSCDFLVIAGGGGGAGGTPDNGAGGGGGAGGYRTSYGTDVSGGSSSNEDALTCNVDGTNYTVTVGAGGTAVTGHTNGNAGSDSVFSTVTSDGGGKGARYGEAGGSGGSAGGSGWNVGTTTSGTSQQGTAGGGGNSGTSVAERASGGGGGAGTAGSTASSTQGGAGGAGLASLITNSSVTRGGGGGGAEGGAGGSGGGGAGGANQNASGTAGTVNTGGGGGGVQHSSSASSGAGGSGLVVLSYPSTNSITVGAGLTVGTSETTVGDRKYIVFTAGTGNVSFS